MLLFRTPPLEEEEEDGNRRFDERELEDDACDVLSYI
jgi:hypothetical protein